MHSWIRLAALGLGAAALALGSATAAGADTTCAVIASDMLGLADSPLVDVIDAKLGRVPELTLLNRADVKKILAEQALSLAMGGSTRASRKDWGDVLRADLLIIMSARKVEDDRILDVDVVETRHGLRLASDSLLWHGDVEALADLIARQIIRQARKVSGGLEHIFAVPPFESGDLLYDYDHLKASYAHLAEDAVAGFPGAVVVELEHAREIARELALSAGDSSVERSLPFYVLGSFRNEGRGEDRRVGISVELRHGERTIAALAEDDLGESDAARFIVKSVRAMALTAVGEPGEPVNEIDVELEADLLEERCRAVRKTGNWKTAIELAEACLLLDPDRVHLHEFIFESCSRYMQHKLIHGATSGLGRMEKPTKGVEVIPASTYLRFAMLGLEHAKSLARHRPLGRSVSTSLGRYVFVDLQDDDLDAADQAARDLYREHCRARLDLLLYVLAHQRTSDWQDTSNFVWLVNKCIEHNGVLPVEERLRAASEAITSLAHFDDPFRLQTDVGVATLEVRKHDADRYDRWLDSLERRTEGGACYVGRCLRVLLSVSSADQIDSARAKLRVIATEALGGTKPSAFDMLTVDTVLKIKARDFDRPRRPILRPSATSADGAIGFEEIRLTAEGELLEYPSRVGRYRWLRCGDGLDVLSCAQGVYAMRTPGVLELIPHFFGPVGEGERRPEVFSVAWDGQYVWVSTGYDGGQIHLFDGATLEHAATFGASDGLPPLRSWCWIAPLEVGKACVIGRIGPSRSWIANVCLRADQVGSGRTEVDVFFEARTAVVRGFARDDPEVAFTPTFTAPVHWEEAGHPLVLVGRSCDSSWAKPIIVDPEARSVRIRPGDWPSHLRVAHTGDRVFVLSYGFRHGRAPVGPVLDVAFPPDFELREILTVEKVSSSPDSGGGVSLSQRWMLPDGASTVHIVHKTWTTIDLTGPAVVRRTELPEYFVPYHTPAVMSAHYGPVLYGGFGVWRVNFLDEQTSNRQPPVPAPETAD